MTASPAILLKIYGMFQYTVLLELYKGIPMIAGIIATDAIMPTQKFRRLSVANIETAVNTEIASPKTAVLMLIF